MILVGAVQLLAAAAGGSVLCSSNLAFLPVLVFLMEMVHGGGNPRFDAARGVFLQSSWSQKDVDGVLDCGV